MANPAFRLTVINRGMENQPRHYDYAAHEERLFQDELAACAAALAQDATPILAFSAIAYGKTDTADDTPEAVVDAINAHLLRVF